MCTVSFLPADDGFVLGMNRDEKRARVIGLPPRRGDRDGVAILAPREPHGGTWISVNDAGVCFALINWHRIEREPVSNLLSRGQVVPAVAGKLSISAASSVLHNLALPQLRPFRLLAIVAGDKCIMEWRWDLVRLAEYSHPWRRQHWYSSGFDELEAERRRAAVFLQAVSPSGPAMANWVRRVHRSHEPAQGPFSICMHRDNAVTVSYTEVEVRPGLVTMRYQAGAPCSSARLEEFTLTRPLAP